MIRRFAALLLWCVCSRSWTMTGNQNQKNSIFVNGLPYTILDSTRSKCFSVIAPHNQIITIQYEAPDLIIAEGMTDATRRAQEEEEAKKNEAEKAEAEQDGMDTLWNQRMKERMERIKSKRLRDTSITVAQKGATVKSIANSKQNTVYDPEGNPIISGTGRIREELIQKKGKIEFMVGNDSGNVEICIQSIVASTKKPARFHLKVDMLASDEEDYTDDDEYEGENVNQKKAKTKDPEHMEHHEITTTMTRLERDLQTLNNRVKACLNNADFNKDQETIFHEQSISMNRASKYWPIIQLIVLIVTGFTQANHIVRYLKSHHIGGY